MRRDSKNIDDYIRRVKKKIMTFKKGILALISLHIDLLRKV